MVQNLRERPQGSTATDKGRQGIGAAEPSLGTRGNVQPDRTTKSRRTSPFHARERSPVAYAGVLASADRRSAGALRLHRGFRASKSLRRAGLHLALRRSYARPRAAMVLHGDMWEPRQAGGSPQPAEGEQGLTAKVRPNREET